MTPALQGTSTATGAETTAPVGDEPRGAHLPGGVGIWVFVLGDMVIFSVYFVIFMVYRTQQRDLFLQSQRQLSLGLAAVNTLVLLASSRFVALAVQSAREADHRRAIRLVAGGGGCGVVF